MVEKSPRPFIVASCGLLGERKGTYELLKAWNRLALPDAEVTLSQFKVIVLMVLWQERASVDALILDELLRVRRS